jgi:hypothetical protein
MGIAGPQTWKPGVHAKLPVRAATRPNSRRKLRSKAQPEPALESKEQEKAMTPPQRDAENLDARSNDEQAPNDPRDQRPFIVKIIMSMATAFWSSICRLFTKFPANLGSLFSRLLVPMLAVTCYSVRPLSDTHDYVFCCCLCQFDVHAWNAVRALCFMARVERSLHASIRASALHGQFRMKLCVGAV